MTLSIIIVNWNGGVMIKECIESIFLSASHRLQNHDYEIIVIDNSSTDDSISYLTGLSNKITLIRNEENIGYSPACNQGMKQAAGTYILLLGSDTLILNDALDECVKFLDNNSKCGAVGCRLLNPDMTVQNNCKRFPKLKNAIFTYLSLNKFNREYDMDSFTYDVTAEVEQISTTFLMMRKSVLEEINYFNEDYKILYNDVDLCRKIWDAGYKILFYHKAQIIHYGSRSTQQAGFSVRRIMYKDIYRYYRNNFGMGAWVLVPVLAVRLTFASAVRR